MKVAFLDRDGVINRDIGYLYEWKKFEYLESVKLALKKLIKENYHLIIVTNQSGIARGYYTEQDFQKLNVAMQEDLKKSGIDLLDVFYCPHYVSGRIKQYAVSCNCRKPKPGLFFQAFEKYNIEIDKSVMFGDQDSDMDASKAAGIQHRFIIGDHSISNSALGSFDNLKHAVNRFLILVNKVKND